MRALFDSCFGCCLYWVGFDMCEKRQGHQHEIQQPLITLPDSILSEWPMQYVSTPLAEKDFLAQRRDPILGYAMYSLMTRGHIESFDIVTAGLSDKARIEALPPNRPMVSAEQRAWDTINYLHLQYSAGLPIDRLACFFPQVVDWWDEYAEYHVAFHSSPDATSGQVAHMHMHDKGYWRAIRLTSFALLLGHAHLLPRIAALWDYANPEMDGLLERLVAPFVPDRDPPPDKCTRHLPYFKLLKVFAAAPDKRAALMSKYMDEWYTASRREPYFGSHTKGREHSYLGLWSFEAAALTYFLDIDDAIYRDKDFYPRDLIDYARTLPRPVEIGGVPESVLSASTHGLRIRSGEPCPRSGWWFTPAKADSRRHFKQGEIMPEVVGDYGVTIWQWDASQQD